MTIIFNIDFQTKDVTLEATNALQFGSTSNSGGAVASVNGQTGVVVLTTTNINEGTNLYFTAARAVAALAATLLDYVTTTALNTALSAYVTASSLASTLANYVTNSSLAITLSAYATQAFVTSQGYITNVITALGYTPENVANKTTNINGASGTYPDTPTVKAYADTKDNRVVQRTGAVIAFDEPANYGTLASPITGNITADLTGARIGVQQLIIHNQVTVPTVPATWIKSAGSFPYLVSNNNYIYVEWLSTNVAKYFIDRA